MPAKMAVSAVLDESIAVHAHRRKNHIRHAAGKFGKRCIHL
jgi:hypothetical protein